MSGDRRSPVDKARGNRSSHRLRRKCGLSHSQCRAYDLGDNLSRLRAPTSSITEYMSPARLTDTTSPPQPEYGALDADFIEVVRPHSTSSPSHWPLMPHCSPKSTRSAWATPSSSSRCSDKEHRCNRHQRRRPFHHPYRGLSNTAAALAAAMWTLQLTLHHLLPYAWARLHHRCRWRIVEE